MKIHHSRLAMIAVGTVSVSCAIGAATLTGYTLGHPDRPAPVHTVNAANVESPLCAMKNGDVLIHGNAGWMYLPDVVVNAIPSRLPTCDPAAYATPVKPAVPATTPADILKTVLPYYGKVAPSWCAEDMVCWIGSKADGRTPAAILESLPDDITSSSQSYADGNLIDKDGNETQPAKWHDYTAGQVIVCPGAVVEMDSYGPGEDAAMPKGGQWAHCDGKALGE